MPATVSGAMYLISSVSPAGTTNSFGAARLAGCGERIVRGEHRQIARRRTRRRAGRDTALLEMLAVGKRGDRLADDRERLPWPRSCAILLCVLALPPMLTSNARCRPPSSYRPDARAPMTEAFPRRRSPAPPAAAAAIAGHGAVSRDQAGPSGLPVVFPDGRFLRAVLRGRGRGGAGARHRADQARPARRRRHPDVRRARSTPPKPISPA